MPVESYDFLSKLSVIKLSFLWQYLWFLSSWHKQGFSKKESHNVHKIFRMIKLSIFQFITVYSSKNCPILYLLYDLQNPFSWEIFHVYSLVKFIQLKSFWNQSKSLSSHYRHILRFEPLFSLSVCGGGIGKSPQKRGLFYAIFRFFIVHLM